MSLLATTTVAVAGNATTYAPVPAHLTKAAVLSARVVYLTASTSAVATGFLLQKSSTTVVTIPTTAAGAGTIATGTREAAAVSNIFTGSSNPLKIIAHASLNAKNFILEVTWDGEAKLYQ